MMAWPWRKKPAPLPCIDDASHGPWTEWISVDLSGTSDVLYFRDCTRCGIRDRRIR